MVVGETSMGMQAVALAFIIPFVLLIFTLFLFMALIENELYAAQKNDICSTLLLDHVTACMMDIRGVETLPILQNR